MSGRTIFARTVSVFYLEHPSTLKRTQRRRSIVSHRCHTSISLDLALAAWQMQQPHAAHALLQALWEATFGLLRFLRYCLDTRSRAQRPLPTSSGRHAWAAATAAAGAKATAVTLVAVAAAALAVTVPVAAPAPNPKVRPIPNCVVALLVWKLVNQCPYRMYVSIACIGRNDVHMHMVESCI